MTTNYPGALDTTTELKNDATNATVSATTHKTAHNNIADAALAIETELGALPKGNFADVAARLAGLIIKTPTASQIVQPTGDFIGVALRAAAAQNTAKMLEIQSSAPATVATWDRLGAINVASIKQGGSALASTHLSDSANILKDPSPSITTPSISTATLTGVPTAPTASVDDNTTKIATTAFVINQGYAKPASPNFTGTPTAPTASQGTDTTQIATTAYTVAEILATQVSGIPSGGITPFAGSSAPTGWLLCDGTAVSRTTYATLFGIVGTAYGVGDGSTTFNLPDLRGRSTVGKGSNTDVDALGDSDGVSVGSRRPSHAASYSFSASSDPGSYHQHSGSLGSAGSHSHSVTNAAASGGGDSLGGPSGPASATGATTGSGGSHTHSVGTSQTESHSHSVTGTVGVSGMTDMSAFIVTNYIIKT